MDEEDLTFYLQIYRGVTRGWETIDPARYSWDITMPPRAIFNDSCPATKALGALARNNAGLFRVGTLIEGEVKELIQVKGQAPPPPRVSSGRRRGCCG